MSDRAILERLRQVKRPFLLGNVRLAYKYCAIDVPEGLDTFLKKVDDMLTMLRQFEPTRCNSDDPCWLIFEEVREFLSGPITTTLQKFYESMKPGTTTQ